MSTMEPDLPEDRDDDLLAAEFALGVLPSAEQAALARRLAHDPAFSQAVSAWEERLAPMAEGYVATDLPPRVKQALDRHLFGIAGAAPRTGFWNNLAVWRGFAAAVTAAFAVALVLALGNPTAAPQPAVMASLSIDGSNVHYIAVYDAGSDLVRLAHLAGSPDPGQVFELWVAEGDSAPVSLGVIPTGATARIETDQSSRALLTSKSHMAISLEPPGGSPTGQPTGAVVAYGDLLEI